MGILKDMRARIVALEEEVEEMRDGNEARSEGIASPSLILACMFVVAGAVAAASGSQDAASAAFLIALLVWMFSS